MWEVSSSTCLVESSSLVPLVLHKAGGGLGMRLAVDGQLHSSGVQVWVA